MNVLHCRLGRPRSFILIGCRTFVSYVRLRVSPDHSVMCMWMCWQSQSPSTIKDHDDALTFGQLERRDKEREWTKEQLAAMSLSLRPYKRTRLADLAELTRPKYSSIWARTHWFSDCIPLILVGPWIGKDFPYTSMMFVVVHFFSFLFLYTMFRLRPFVRFVWSIESINGESQWKICPHQRARCLRSSLLACWDRSCRSSRLVHKSPAAFASLDLLTLVHDRH